MPRYTASAEFQLSDSHSAIAPIDSKLGFTHSPGSVEATPGTILSSAERSVYEEKSRITSTPRAAEAEFKDLIFALERNTFEGGEDSASLSSLRLDFGDRGLALKRVSIADTHL